MPGSITAFLRGRTAHLSALSVLAAAVILFSLHQLKSGPAFYEVRLHIFPDHGLTQAYLSKFPPHIRALIIERRRTRIQASYTIQFWTRVGELKSREVVSAALRRMQPSHRAAVVGDAPDTDETVRALSHLEFMRDGGSEILVVRCRHADGAVAADLVESVVKAFEAVQSARLMKNRDYALKYLKDAYERLDAEIQEVFTATGPDTSGVRFSEEMLSQRLAVLLERLDRAALERIDADAAVRAHGEAREVETAVRCAGEQGAFEAARGRYLDRHPAHQQAKVALDACMARIDSDRDNERRLRDERARVALLKEQGFGAAVFALSDAMERLRLLSISRIPGEKEIDLVKKNTEAALKRYLDAFYDDRAFRPDVRVIDRHASDARPPWGLWLTAFAAVLAGAGTAGGLWSVRRAVRARASGAAEIERLGTNVIVEIPPAGHGIRRLKRMLGLVDLYTHDRPASDTSERFKHLRTMLSRALPDGPAALCVTSSIPGEGKTFCAANIAITFAAAGMRTILVDCDLRKARATEIFDLAGARGLGDILFVHDSPAGLCRPTHIPSLSVLPAGTVDRIYTIDPDRFAALLDELKGSFDRIVIDLPPLTVSSDPLLAAKVADGTILVARKDYVPMHILRESLSRLQKPGITFLGTVLNWSGLVSGYFLEY